jgi:hypothetical protein
MFEWCPVCGNRMISVDNTDVCINNECRTAIKDNEIFKMDAEQYIMQGINEATLNEKYYLLMRTDVNMPMLLKNSNKPLEDKKNRLCVVRATDKRDAIEQIKEIVPNMQIREEAVVQVIIKDI